MKNIAENTLIVTLTVGDLKNIIAEEISKAIHSVPSPVSEIMNIDEVVKLTGYSKSTIFKYTSQKSIPHHKPGNGGRRLCFNRAEILDWMQTHKVQTNEQYCEEAINNLITKKL